MKWRKIGLVYSPHSRAAELVSHAANPLPVHLEGDVFRVFFCGRDAINRSSVGAVDVDMRSGRTISGCEQPVFKHGEPGSFFADGVGIGNVFMMSGRRYMGFMAWQTQGLDHWRGDIGRLELDDSLRLKLDPSGPYFKADNGIDGCSLSYPWVQPIGSDLFAMYYGSTVSWSSPNGEMIHPINYATSSDGEHWTRHGVAIPWKLGEAQAFSRPSVFRKKNGTWGMLYSFRRGDGGRYRIGYAESDDAFTWARKDEQAGIDVSPSGWDSDMVCYPYVFDHDGNRYMLYNGNGYGRTGFGLAILEEE